MLDGTCGLRSGSDLRSSPPLELRSRRCERNRNHGTAPASRPTFLFGRRHVVHWLRWQLPSFPAASQRGPTDGSCSSGTAASSLARHSLPAESLGVLASGRGPGGSETSFSPLLLLGRWKPFCPPSPSQLSNHLVKSHSAYTGSRLPQQQQNPRRHGLPPPPPPPWRCVIRSHCDTASFAPAAESPRVACRRICCASHCAGLGSMHPFPARWTPDTGLDRTGTGSGSPASSQFTRHPPPHAPPSSASATTSERAPTDVVPPLFSQARHTDTTGEVHHRPSPSDLGSGRSKTKRPHLETQATNNAILSPTLVLPALEGGCEESYMPLDFRHTLRLDRVDAVVKPSVAAAVASRTTSHSPPASP